MLDILSILRRRPPPPAFNTVPDRQRLLRSAFGGTSRSEALSLVRQAFFMLDEEAQGELVRELDREMWRRLYL